MITFTYIIIILSYSKLFNIMDMIFFTETVVYVI